LSEIKSISYAIGQKERKVRSDLHRICPESTSADAFEKWGGFYLFVLYKTNSKTI
jgi:RNA polymerase subunit RPABC4/transcription elongation factor Spt4